MMTQINNSASITKWIVDGLVFLALVGALIGVYAADRPISETVGSPGPKKTFVVSPIGERPSTTSSPKKLRLAVTTPVQFDDMGSLLGKLGDGYKYDGLDLNDLRKASKLREYNVVFLTCGGVPDDWLHEAVGEGKRGTLRRVNQQVMNEVRNALREFVNGGGTLYASDLHLKILSTTFDNLLDESLFAEGRVQKLNASVVDPQLREVLGNSIELNFDKEGWLPAAVKGESIQRLLVGDYLDGEGSKRSAPLLVKFRHGEGTVIFTSFHNGEAANSAAALKLLKYLVFSAVTAKEETAAEALEDVTLSTPDKGLLTPDKTQRSFEGEYECAKSGRLVFTMVFPPDQVKVRLIARSPKGDVYETEQTAAFVADVPLAEQGKWTYSVVLQSEPKEGFFIRRSVFQK